MFRWRPVARTAHEPLAGYPVRRDLFRNGGISLPVPLGPAVEPEFFCGALLLGLHACAELLHSRKHLGLGPH